MKWFRARIVSRDQWAKMMARGHSKLAVSTCYCTSGGGFIPILYFLRDRSNLYSCWHAVSFYWIPCKGGAVFPGYRPIERTGRVLIYHPPAPAPESFNKRLLQNPYCGLCHPFPFPSSPPPFFAFIVSRNRVLENSLSFR